MFRYCALFFMAVASLSFAGEMFQSVEAEQYASDCSSCKKTQPKRLPPVPVETKTEKKDADKDAEVTVVTPEVAKTTPNQ